MRNVAIDFGRMGTWWGGSSRYFSPGFVEAACDAASPRELGGPGLEFYADQAEAGLQGFKLLDGSADAVYCDEWVHTPTLVVQHDDIGNLWHNYMDHWRVWVALAILQQPACVPSYGHVGAVRLPRNGGGMEDRSATEEGGTLLRRSRSQRRSDADPGAADAADGSFCPAPAAASTWWPRGDASDLDSRSSASLQAMCQPGEHLVLGLNPDEMQLLNMDARIMCSKLMPDGSPAPSDGSNEDCRGPYFAQYERWFGKGIVSARDFGTKRVCFAAVGWAANSRPRFYDNSHIWRWFESASECDVKSPLFRQFAAYNMERWGLSHTLPAACRPHAVRAALIDERSARHWQPPALDNGGSGTVASRISQTVGCERPYIRILYLVRKGKPFSSEPVQDRVVANEAEFVTMLQGKGASGPFRASTRRASALVSDGQVRHSEGDVEVDVKVDAADFTGVPYEQQLRRVRAAHIVIGMHGAGLVHVLHSPDTDSCGGPTALIELLPKHRAYIQGVKHFAAYMDRRYWRYENHDPARETDRGTVVDLDRVWGMVGEAVQANVAGRTSPSCLAAQSVTD